MAHAAAHTVAHTVTHLGALAREDVHERTDAELDGVAQVAPNNGQEARVAGQVIALAGLAQQVVRPHREPIGRVRGAVRAQHRHGLHGRPLPPHLVGRNPVVHDYEANRVQLLHERVCVDLTAGPWWRCNGSSSRRLARHLSPRHSRVV